MFSLLFILTKWRIRIKTTIEKLDTIISDLDMSLSNLLELREDYLSTNSESRRAGIEYTVNVFEEYLKRYKLIRNPFAKGKNN